MYNSLNAQSPTLNDDNTFCDLLPESPQSCSSTSTEKIKDEEEINHELLECSPVTIEECNSNTHLSNASKKHVPCDRNKERNESLSKETISSQGFEFLKFYILL